MSMNDEPIIFPRKKSISRPFQPPVIPQEEWCDFRIDYEAGMTLKDIADKYICDSRTVRKCILLNRSSKHIGEQIAPTRLYPFTDKIEELYATYKENEKQKAHSAGICRISSFITEELRKEGYQGSERTVRNYLRQKYLIFISKD